MQDLKMRDLLGMRRAFAVRVIRRLVSAFDEFLEVVLVFMYTRLRKDEVL